MASSEAKKTPNTVWPFLILSITCSLITSILTIIVSIDSVKWLLVANAFITGVAETKVLNHSTLELLKDLVVLAWSVLHFCLGLVYVSVLSMFGGSSRPLLSRVLTIVTTLAWTALLFEHLVILKTLRNFAGAFLLVGDLAFIVGMILSERLIPKKLRAKS